MFLNADGYHVVRQAVPDGGSGDWGGPAADGRQFHGRPCVCIQWLKCLGAQENGVPAPPSSDD